MKIPEDLLILTKEHHIALSLANKCINTAKYGSIDEIDSLCSDISEKFVKEFDCHFNTEEKTIFELLKYKSEKLLQICNKLTIEHKKLKQLANDLVYNTGSLSNFGLLLKQHARLEDRELFPNVHLLSVSERQTILFSSYSHPKPKKI